MVILGFGELLAVKGCLGQGLWKMIRGWGASRGLRILSGHLGPAGVARPELTPSVFLSPAGPRASPVQHNKGPAKYGPDWRGPPAISQSPQLSWPEGRL